MTISDSLRVPLPRIPGIGMHLVIADEKGRAEEAKYRL